MNQYYFFVGPKEILNRVKKEFEGTRINQIKDILDWVKATNQILINQQIIATFIINENQELVISDRHSEHVICAGGKDVLSAGEITFEIEKNEVIVCDVTNQSTGYCPKPNSWIEVEKALDKIGIKRPAYFTKAFEFRFCTTCKTKNLVKEGNYECAVCLSDLDLNWNIDKIGRTK